MRQEKDDDNVIFVTRGKEKPALSCEWAEDFPQFIPPKRKRGRSYLFEEEGRFLRGKRDFFGKEKKRYGDPPRKGEQERKGGTAI